MPMLRTVVLAAVSAASLLAAASASAASFQVWNGSTWVNSGTVTFTGPTNARYLGVPAPCNATFTMDVSAGVARVRAASFSGSATCTGITTNINPANAATWWPVSAPVAHTGTNPPFSGAPTLSPTLHSITISGIRITIPPPLNATCPSTTSTGSVTGTLDEGDQTGGPIANRFVFRATLGPCSVETRPTTDSTAAPNYALVASPAIRVVP